MKIPTQKTLKKYGLTEQEFLAIWEAQGKVCPICKQDKDTTVIDHEHVPNWKKLPPEKRKLYVRGLICTYCNQRRVGKGVTKWTAYRAYLYLRDYERKPK